ALGARRLFAEAFSPPRWRRRISALVNASARVIGTRLPVGVRGRIVRATPEYRSIDRAFHVADEQARTLAPLQDLSTLALSLRRHRPPNLHVNGCGAFQLMAREHWHDLRGYPEIDGFS